jgi:adenylylsulfate kinase-like enzyme
MIYWLTGQPGAGKTTLGDWLVASFPSSKVTHIDGDDIRKIFDNQDYSEEGRRKNVDLAQKIAHFIHSKNEIAIVSLVSPYRDQREYFKQKIGPGIVEIYVHCFTDRGRTHFHVHNYEPPLENFIDIDTTNDKEYESVLKLRKILKI